MPFSRTTWSVLAAAAALNAGCMADGMDLPAAEAELGAASQEIVNGTINNGDPALAFIWLGGGSCSGTMVSKKVIVTARHCFVDAQGNRANLANLAIYFGTQPTGADPSIAVVDYLVHDTADLAVLTMAQDGAPAPIPMNTRAPAQGQQIRVAGYGVTSENGQDSGLKRTGNTSVAGTETVQGFGSVFYVGATGSKTCYGDSGGPAFTTIDGVEYLAGVTSFGTGPCENAGTLDGELRVDIYHDWIKSYITQKDPNGLPAGGGAGTGGGTGPGTGGGDGTGTGGGDGTGGGVEGTGGASPTGMEPVGTGELEAPALFGGCDVTTGAAHASTGGSSGGLGILLLIAVALLARVRPRAQERTRR